MHLVGLDLGSSYTKGVLVDASDYTIADSLVLKTGYNFKEAAKKIIDHFSVRHSIKYPIYTCGYGREQVEVEFVPNSEIVALAKAVYKQYGTKTSILDIGGQDTKYVVLNEKGHIERFKINRKCAAGTGAFIEEIGFRLGVPASEFKLLAKQANKEIKINSFCTVFAISEVVGLIKLGAFLPDIIKGIYTAIVERAAELIPQHTVLILTGGVPEQHPMVVEMFKQSYPNTKSSKYAQLMAAYGCVLLSCDGVVTTYTNFI